MSMMRQRGLLLATLLLAVLAAGCADVPLVGRHERTTAFDDATDNYGKMLRWGYFEEAAKYLRAQDGSAIVPDLDRVARYRVTSYTISNKLLADTGREGRVLATIEYYEIDSGVLRTLRDEQLWWHDRESDHWFLASPLPAFGIDTK
ncbi:MAG: hypothetical protein H6977_16955 [Gammaproteobacteria bacterium]|nr:hypothetical protein [Gammaproteobacteria bacterium]MCP5201692.1 hypothetical protein [Gammaproteobacteria bacterium]